MGQVQSIGMLAWCCMLVSAGLACSNKVSMSGELSSASGIFSGFIQTAEQSFEHQKGVAESLNAALGREAALISYLNDSEIFFGLSDGKSLVVNPKTLEFAFHSVSLPDEAGKADWIYAMGEKYYWGAAGGKLFYRSRIGDELIGIEEELEKILDSRNSRMKIISVSSTDLLAVVNDKLLWLNAEPQLKRQFFLKLDSVSLAHYDASQISGAGVIRGHGVWIVVGDYIIYILRDSSGQYVPERRRFKGFSAGKTRFIPKKIAMHLARDEKQQIIPQGPIFAMGSSGLYLSKGTDSGSAQSEPTATPTVVASATPTPTATPARKTAAVLQTEYTNKVRAIFSAYCSACHPSVNPLPLGTFDDLKIRAGKIKGRLQSNPMPPAVSAQPSSTERTAMIQFLSDLEYLP